MRLLGISKVIRQLTGAGQVRFVELLMAQIDTTVKAVHLVREMSQGRAGGQDLSRHVQDLEREGDRYRGEILAALSVTLVTPIDREDLFRVSRTIDDVLDNLRDFAIEWQIYDLAPRTTFVPLLDAVLDGLADLRVTVSSLRDDPASVTALAGRTKTKGNRVRRLFQRAVADLFDTSDVHIDILKVRELLRRLDIVGIRLREAADVLFDASIKRSY